MTEQQMDYSKLKVWIVEDDASSIGLVQRLMRVLEIEDYTITTNIEAVMDAMKGGADVDVVLIDVHVHERSGYELLTAMQGDPRYAETKNIMLSATSGPIGVREAQQAEADGFITKPLTLDKLKRAIRTVLQGENFWE